MSENPRTEWGVRWDSGASFAVYASERQARAEARHIPGSAVVSRQVFVSEWVETPPVVVDSTLVMVEGGHFSGCHPEGFKWECGYCRDFEVTGRDVQAVLAEAKEHRTDGDCLAPPQVRFGSNGEGAA